MTGLIPLPVTQAFLEHLSILLTSALCPIPPERTATNPFAPFYIPKVLTVWFSFPAGLEFLQHLIKQNINIKVNGMGGPTKALALFLFPPDTASLKKKRTKNEAHR